MNVSYASLAEVAAAMKSDKFDVDALRPYPVIASRRVDLLMGSPKRPAFAPYYEARKIRVTPDRLNSADGTLALDMPLLEAVSIVAGTTTLTLGTNVELFPDSTQPPFSTLRLSGDCPNGWGYYAPCNGCSTPYFVTVTGWWGYASDYASAWLQVDALDGALNDTTRTITLHALNDVTIYGVAPRASVHSIIRIDDEVMLVSASDVGGGNTLTVARRGDLGTTAASHLNDAPVYVWQAEDAIRNEVARQAGLLFQRRGAYTTVQVEGMSEIRYPTDLLQSLRNVVWMYANG